MTFAGHAFKLFAQKEIIVELQSLPSFNAHDFEDKSLLAEKCHELVSAKYDNII
jgi:hypothetical protein